MHLYGVFCRPHCGVAIGGGIAGNGVAGGGRAAEGAVASIVGVAGRSSTTGSGASSGKTSSGTSSGRSKRVEVSGWDGEGDEGRGRHVGDMKGKGGEM